MDATWVDAVTDVLVKPAYVPTQTDNGDTTRFGPTAWKAPRLFSAGADGQLVMRDSLSATGASWVTPSVALLGLTYAVGDLLVASGPATLAKLTDVAVGSVLVSGGIGVAPAWSANPTLTSITGAGTVLTLNNSDLRPNVDRGGNIGTAALRMDTGFFFTALVVGSIPSSAGEVRLPNNGAGISFRNAANSGNLLFGYYDNSNVLNLADASAANILFAGPRLSFGGLTASFPALKRNSTTLAVRLADDSGDALLSASALVVGTNPALTGALRLGNNTYIYSRDQANGADILVLGVDNTNVINLGSGNFRVLLQPGTQDIQWGKALVALGGGAAPTLGTIGGSGPATAAQNSWERRLDSAGNPCWVPVWK